MNLTGSTSFSGPLRFELENYFPAAHYKQAIDKAFKEQAEYEVLPDGGSRPQYYWSGEDRILYHTEKEEDMVIPFFNTVDTAEKFLENQADQNGKERYQGLVLRKTGNRRVEEATDVLTDQSGPTDFGDDYILCDWTVAVRWTKGTSPFLSK